MGHCKGAFGLCGVVRYYHTLLHIACNILLHVISAIDYVSVSFSGCQNMTYKFISSIVSFSLSLATLFDRIGCIAGETNTLHDI